MVRLCRNATLWIKIDRNFQVTEIVVFTKFDQFKRNIQMQLEDEGRAQEVSLNDEVETIFNQQYLAKLNGVNGPPPFVRLESEGHDVVN